MSFQDTCPGCGAIFYSREARLGHKCRNYVHDGHHWHRLTKMPRVESLEPEYPPVSIEQATARLRAYAAKTPQRKFHAPSNLADVIWPNRRFRSAQGAAAAATRILKRCGCYFDGNGVEHGWRIPKA